MRVLVIALALLISVPVFGNDALLNVLGVSNPIIEENFLNSEDLKTWINELKCRKRPKGPKPPKLPRNFRWKGRYIVPDLIDPETGKIGVDVPLIWNGNNGNVQMIAGSENDPIFFTNLIFNGKLYTYTYKWPCLQPEFLPPLEPCRPLLDFTLEDLNDLFATSFFVGPEILEEKTSHDGHHCRRVNHFRLAIAFPPNLPPGFQIRIPFLEADIYVDRKDPSKIWKLLHFGFQNLYDPNLDEWIVIEEMKDGPGKIKLPPACRR